MISVIGRVENIEENQEKAGKQHFLLFPQSLQKPSSLVSLHDMVLW